MLAVVYKLFSVAFLCGAIMAENTSAQGKNKMCFQGNGAGRFQIRVSASFPTWRKRVMCETRLFASVLFQGQTRA